MKISIIRRVGLTVCAVFALSYAAPAFAQFDTILGGLTGGSAAGSGTASTSGIGTSIGSIGGSTNFLQMATSGLSAIQSGGTGQIPNVASFLNQNSTTPSLANQQSLTQSLTNIFSGGGGINPQSASGLIGGMMSGNISGGLGSSLSSIPGLGNISNVSGLTNILGNSSITSAINSLPIGQQGGAISSVISAASGSGLLSSLAGGTGASQVARSITSNFPGATQALAGASGIAGGATQAVTQAVTNAVSQVAGQALGNVAGSLVGGLLGGGSNPLSTAAGGGSGGGAKGCTSGGCCAACGTQIPQHYQEVRDHVTTEFEQHRSWILRVFWKEHMLPALMLMAEQLTVAGVKQVEMIGTLLDAKHQLETQRVMQEMMAQAHKDYQPSEGMCTFGTSVRSLAASERKSNATQMAFAQRMMQRQNLSGDVISKESSDSDIRSRMTKFISTYCDKADNNNGLEKLCTGSSADAKRRNVDVDFTRNIESRLTLDINFAEPSGSSSATTDEEDVFALSANLFSHNIAPRMDPELLASEDNRVRLSAAEKFMDLRAVYAKRSVAQNSFAALTGMRANGDTASAPYTKRLLYELGVTDTAEIEKILGAKPSYFAQMEVLTKKLYQNPVFYTELYDKPANVERKGAAMQAIGLMQDRDLYNSLIRSEAVLSVLLETMLEKEQAKIVNAQRRMNSSGGAR